MASSNSQVSVFHFTSNISSAKIRKYKMATERGMNTSGAGSGFASTVTSGPRQTSPSPVLDLSTMEPPAKRPKLKLNVRPPVENSDTIAVSRPKRESSLRIRYSENMVIDSKDLDEDEESQGRPRASSIASSGLSSLTSVHSIAKEPVQAKTGPTDLAKRKDYSRDFMSYYVDGSDEEEDEATMAPPALPKPRPESELPKKQPSKPPSTSTGPAAARPDQATAYHTQPKPAPRPQMPPAQRNIVSVPRITVVDHTLNAIPQSEPHTVAGMVKKLEALSAALTEFGGIPPIPMSPELVARQEPAPPGERKDVDNFLAMFDDDDDNDSDDKDGQKEKPAHIIKNLDYKLDHPGEQDKPITYGIQFIQNALRSWAIQRIQSNYSQQFGPLAMNNQETHAKVPSRPRKYAGENNNLAPVIEVDMAKTPEGTAIAAFQEVLDSGCLQVNARLPIALTRALRRLYMQIDHLINQGSRKEPQWQCMSYSAQIAAQKVRVDKWKDAHARAQQEMARQQQIAQEQVMRRMGIPYHQRGHLTAEQAQHQHAMDLERKRSLQHAAQQPHLTQYLTNPLRLNTFPGELSTSQAPTTIPANIASLNSPSIAPTSGQTNPNEPSLTPADGKGVYLDKIKLYMPNFLPRSGQSMKFSFAPQSELALKTFGAQAFPTNHTGPNLPNRGPMSANPLISKTHAHTPNGNTAPAMQTKMPNDAPVQKNGDVEMIDVGRKPAANGLSNRTGSFQTNASSTPAGISPNPAANTNGTTANWNNASPSSHSQPVVID